MNLKNAKNSKLICSRIAPVLLFCMLSVATVGQTSFQFGLTANPMVNWMKPEASEMEKGGIRGGFEFGFMADINFTDNYILATGLTMSLNGGNVDYNDSILMYLHSPDTARFAGTVNSTFKVNYLNLPIVFKMRTNELGNSGKVRAYGGLGVVTAFRIKARVDAENDGTTIFDNENFAKNKDQTGGVFNSKVFNLQLHVEAGIELPFSDKTALVAGIFYRNGFVNVIDDGDEDKIALHNLGLRIGVLF